ncbi:MAG: histidine triad family protein [Solirubrobacterales bacterium]|nr:histidine triad family protein [Solirubrobacterales bacterium]
MAGCLFCRIVAGELDAATVYEDEHCLGFLDHRPLFPGHTLLVPRQHHETLADLPPDLVAPFFTAVQLLSVAVPKAMEAEGSFVAMNNRVSQSVPHLHAHIAPRRPKDGLRGFFWPRTKYEDDAHLGDVAGRIREAIATVRG